jgi:hypothetical protein
MTPAEDSGAPSQPGDRQPDADAAMNQENASGRQPGEAGSHRDQPSIGDGPANDADPGQPADQGSITHYHGEFKGQHVDLFTDGTRWAPGDRVPGENAVGQKPDRSPGDTSDLPSSGEQLLDMEDDKLSRSRPPGR